VPQAGRARGTEPDVGRTRPRSSAAMIAVVAATVAAARAIASVTIPIATAIAVPLMIVVEPASRSVPIAGKELAAVVARTDPAGAEIRGSGPVSGMPPVAARDRIPVPVDPDIFGSRSPRHHAHDARRWRGTDSNTDGHLGASDRWQRCEHGDQESRDS